MTLGPASGVIGTLLAMEVMHLLVDDAPWPQGRALLVDMRTLETRWEAVERRSDCSACNHLECIHLARTPLELDEAGWEELSALLRQVGAATRRIESESQARAPGSARRRSMLGILHFPRA